MKFKRILLSVAIMVICLAAIFIPKTANAMPSFEDATIMDEEIEVMIRPSMDSAVITTLGTGARIGVFCEESPGWYRIIYGNYRGYVKVNDVFLPSRDKLSANVRVDNTYVRVNPTAAGLSLGELNAGYPISITNVLGEWYKIEGESVMGEEVEGYISKNKVMQSDIDIEENSIVLKVGMEGEEVKKMQEKLTARGFYGYYASGVFDDDDTSIFVDDNKGTNLYKSLRYFQQKAGLEVTGIADKETLEKLYSDEDIHSYAHDKGVEGSVMVSRWWEAVKYEFAKGSVATIMDVRTRKTFKVQRYSGTNHADVEPLTKADTDIMRQCYGGSWSWDRRPVWVTVGSTTYAASMNGMPHASHEARISDNGFNGHFCVHFKDSYGHGSYSEDPKHAQCVKDAYYSSLK